MYLKHVLLDFVLWFLGFFDVEGCFWVLGLFGFF